MEEIVATEATAPPPETVHRRDAPSAPGEIRAAQLYAEPLPALVERAHAAGLRVAQDRTRRQFVFDLLRTYASRGTSVFMEGVVEMTGETHGFLRAPHDNFRPGPEDPYIAGGILKRLGLRNGHFVSGRIRAPREREKYLAMDELITIEGLPAESWSEQPDFDALTAMFPDQRIILENDVTKSMSARAIDLVAPLGRGQRGLIVAPARTGKTILLKEIARAVRATAPDIRVILLLLDERPEEVTDLKRSVDAEVYSSTFDESPVRHVQVAELVADRAKRLVEMGGHVLILLDSITRMARGYNALQPGKGRTMSGGMDAKAMAKPKKFFGSARNVEEGGSLTILGTALIETESRMDEVIFEEFKGTGNMELHLDRSLVEKRIYPAIHVLKSGTRREELLYHPAEWERVQILRRTLAELPHEEAIELLLQNIEATKSNAELLLAGLR